MTYPTLPFALVFQLARLTPERAQIGGGKRQVGIHVHHDRSVRSRRVEIERDDQLPAIEGEVARMITEGECHTVTLTFSTDGDEKSDIGVIIEKGRDPMLFSWEWSPQFGITLVEDAALLEKIDTWSGVKLAKDMIGR